MDKSNSIDNREPGFNSIPSPDPQRQAPTDSLDEIVGGIMDQIQEDATGEKPSTTNTNNSNSNSNPNKSGSPEAKK